MASILRWRWKEANTERNIKERQEWIQTIYDVAPCATSLPLLSSKTRQPKAQSAGAFLSGPNSQTKYIVHLPNTDCAENERKLSGFRMSKTKPYAPVIHIVRHSKSKTVSIQKCVRVDGCATVELPFQISMPNAYSEKQRLIKLENCVQRNRCFRKFWMKTIKLHSN